MLVLFALASSTVCRTFARYRQRLIGQISIPVQQPHKVVGTYRTSFWVAFSALVGVESLLGLFWQLSNRAAPGPTYRKAPWKKKKHRSIFLSLAHPTLLGVWKILPSTFFNLSLNRTFHPFPGEKQQWTRWERETLEGSNAPYHVVNLILFINLLHGTVRLMGLTLKWKRSPYSLLSKNALMTLGRYRTRNAFPVWS